MNDKPKNLRPPEPAPTDTGEVPVLVDRATFQAELDALRVREKARTHEGDAIAAARRRLPTSDDFSNPGSGWAPDSGQTGVGSGQFAPDGYHVVALQPQNVLNTFSVASPYGVRMSSMSVAADGTLLSGTSADGWGVRCDQGGRTGLRYTFEIHGDGGWVIFKIDEKGSAAL